jgi:hypothetical protein
MKRRLVIPLLLPAMALANHSAYERRMVRGWTVVVSRRLLAEEPITAADSLNLLDEKLKMVEEALPADAVKQLRTVPIWMEHPDDGIAKCAAYHPSEKWLTNHGHNPEKARSVEFGNPELFIQWSEIQPSMVLHELAHAYHHQVLTHTYQPVKGAYQSALRTGLYEKVKHAKGHTKRAYALNNEKEFFAELSEAYFGRNDFFPFVREDLKAYDPSGYSTIKNAWKV